MVRNSAFKPYPRYGLRNLLSWDLGALLLSCELYTLRSLMLASLSVLISGLGSSLIMVISRLSRAGAKI